jgi:hypothetical protein
MSEPNATNVIAGPGLLYVAPLGTTQPVFDMHGEYPVIWPAGWVAVGYTDSGIDSTYTPTIKEISVDEEAAPVLDILEKEKFVISAHLAEATLANLNAAIAASALTTDSTNAYQAVAGGSLALNYTMVGVQGPAPGTNLARVIILQKAIAMAAVSLKMTRKDKVTMPVTFDARKISGQSLFKIYDLTSTAS